MKLFAKDRKGQVGRLGESLLIEEIQDWLGGACPPSPRGIGDDCAVLPKIKGHPLVTVDPVVYGIHFDDSVPPKWVGEKLFKRNLSDIAAMGGTPKAAVIALGLEAAVSADWLKAFYQGLAAVSKRYGVAIVGGDVTSQPGFSASLTLIGEAGKRVLTRTGARIGDRIYVTGKLGKTLSTGHHYRFTPRLPEGEWLSKQKAVRSLIDVSDGVAKDVQALTPPGAGVFLNEKAVPRRAGATISQALTDGEDYELLFSVSAETNARTFEAKWKKAFPKTALSSIGSFVALGKLRAPRLASLRGYEHLR